MKLKVLILFLIGPIFPLQAQSKVNDYLHIPGPLQLAQKTYNLAWSSHPNENYFKQEYVSSDENINKYNSMVLIDFVKGDFTITDIVDQKVSELEKMKKINPIVNYQVLENNGEYILDFLISENSQDGKDILIAERNVYRYKAITKNNNKGILLFAVSERGYKENMDQFLNNLKKNPSKLIETVGNYQLPDIEIK
ncbi:hypothetical protein C1637_20575 [Chryseobacterium lactis]|uniref:Uncharacterized protein n=1 Tax=Chryseobacterium lactis TaxID=1241981 RepID=A0A3G6RE02_CHRLC|nr:hypothetical protein [Chryseobacterium lactis]AZA82663.1 hypothetical protein EG342_12585 [Chryseobacterium lactis]AZB03045.1 hypothetical protein EG341_03450 [Chryseobacterium lactis]PNW11815.1 hypothetical protein C1637_20575 [Chryseobacterium lactis]